MLCSIMSNLCHSMDCSLPGSSVHEIYQARILEWVAFPTPGGLLHPGIKLMSLASPALADKFFTTTQQMVTAAMKLKDAYSLEGKL